jgi:hypothetical protein
MKTNEIKKLEEKGIKITESSISVVQIFKPKNKPEIHMVRRFELDKNTEKYIATPVSELLIEPASDIHCSRIEVDFFYKVEIKTYVKKLFTCESDFELDCFISGYILNEIANLKNIEIIKYNFNITDCIHTFYNKDMTKVIAIERNVRNFGYNIHLVKIVDIKRYF